ncbi:PAS domain S-box protein [Mesorhizobium sp. M1066]|uniref:PAS domain S-box protein n=1 Tax=unclassified Mesorhizobium TaxID=325217 RepID=UPI0033354510
MTQSSSHAIGEIQSDSHRLQAMLDIPPDFVELLPVAAYACDASGRVLWFNKRAVDLWGRAPRIGDDTELFCGSYKLYFGGQEINRAETPMAVALRTGEAIQGAEGMVERPDGSQIWATVHIEPVKDTTGAVLGAINCFHDTTELHQARAKTMEGEERVRGILEAMPTAVYTTDAVGRITYYNEAAAKLAGREPSLGSDEWCVTWKLYWPDGTPLPHDQCPMALALKEQQPNSGMEAVAERPDGTRVPFLPYPTPLFDASGRLTGAVNVLVDITDRKRTERLQEELAQSDANLSAELEATRKLQEIGAELIHEQDIHALYQKLVDAAAMIMRSEYASMQMFYPDRGSEGELRLLAFRGFNAQAAEFWEWVRIESESTCGVALRTRKRVVVEDVSRSDYMAGTEDLETYLQTGIHAVQTTPLLSRSGQLLGMVSTHWNRPHRPADSELRLLDLLARQAADLLERASAEERLRDSEEQLRLATEAADVGLWDVDPVNDRLFWPARVKAMFGISAEAAVSMADFYAGLHPEDRERTKAAFAAALDPARRALYDVEYRTIGKEDGVTRWVAAKGRGVFNAGGTCIRVIGTALDITERKRREDHQKLLLNELNHRVKNTLVTVQSMAMQTLRNSPDKMQAQKLIEARLIALSKAHDMLTQENWEGAFLHQIIEKAIAPYRGQLRDRFEVEGPGVWVSPKFALALAMGMHELCTNAVKYGGLSNDAGKVRIEWTVAGLNGTRELSIRWSEAGGPSVKPPSRQGFGSRLIERGLKQDLGGEVRIDFDPAGVICTIKAPLERARGRAEG